MSAEEKCLLCFRITAKDIANIVHCLPFTPDVQHELLALCVAKISLGYSKNHALFCGKGKKRIIGGLLYFLGCKDQRFKVTQTMLADIFHELYGTQTSGKGYGDITFRNGADDWCSVLDPGLFTAVQRARCARGGWERRKGGRRHDYVS